jgi:glycosyltransferase involved in cell wall biosynthesis
MRRAVFVHPRGAGQFRHLASRLASRDWDVTILSENFDVPLPGVRYRRLAPVRRNGAQSPIALAAHYADNGQRTAEALEELARSEGPPDLVIGHAGWGDLVFARDVLPERPALAYFEYFFRPEGGDVGFDPAQAVDSSVRRRLTARNMAQLATLDAVPAGVTPTRWQLSRFPEWGRRKIALCHEGIDLDFCRPGRPGRIELGSRILGNDRPVITFAARGLEPYRGFPQFMRAAAKAAALRPDILFAVAGSDEVSYGARPANAANWREAMLQETGLDPERIIFAGQVDHRTLVRLFQLSSAHVYLTMPFVLSWSMLEAMACGALVIGSATPPVTEVVEDGRNGLLADFWDGDALAARMIEAVDRGGHLRGLREAARRTIASRFALEDCLERQEGLVNRLVN